MITEQSATATTQLLPRNAARNRYKTSNGHVSLPAEVLLTIFEFAIIAESRVLHLGRHRGTGYRGAKALNECPAPFNVCREMRNRLLKSKMLLEATPDENSIIDFGLLEIPGLRVAHHGPEPRCIRRKEFGEPIFLFDPEIDTLQLSEELYTMIFYDIYPTGEFSTYSSGFGNNGFPAMFRYVKRLILSAASCNTEESLLNMHNCFTNLEHLTVRFEADRHQKLTLWTLDSRVENFKNLKVPGIDLVLLDAHFDTDMSTPAVELYYGKSTAYLRSQKHNSTSST